MGGLIRPLFPAHQYLVSVDLSICTTFFHLFHLFIYLEARESERERERQTERERGGEKERERERKRERERARERECERANCEGHEP